MIFPICSRVTILRHVILESVPTHSCIIPFPPAHPINLWLNWFHTITFDEVMAIYNKTITFFTYYILCNKTGNYMISKPPPTQQTDRRKPWRMDRLMDIQAALTFQHGTIIHVHNIKKKKIKYHPQIADLHVHVNVNTTDRNVKRIQKQQHIKYHY